MAALATATVPFALSIGAAWEITGARTARPQWYTLIVHLPARSYISAEGGRAYLNFGVQIKCGVITVSGGKLLMGARDFIVLDNVLTQTSEHRLMLRPEVNRLTNLRD